MKFPCSWRKASLPLTKRLSGRAGSTFSVMPTGFNNIVTDMPLFVINDIYGNDLHKTGIKGYKK